MSATYCETCHNSRMVWVEDDEAPEGYPKRYAEPCPACNGDGKLRPAPIDTDAQHCTTCADMGYAWSMARDYCSNDIDYVEYWSWQPCPDCHLGESELAAEVADDGDPDGDGWPEEHWGAAPQVNMEDEHGTA